MVDVHQVIPFGKQKLWNTTIFNGRAMEGYLFLVFFSRFWRFLFGFLVLCFPASLLFCCSTSLLFCFSASLLFMLLCFSCFSAFHASLLFLLFAFPASLLFMLLCFSALPAAFLFCFSAFPASLLLCFCASVPFYFYDSTFSFLQSCVFAARLPAPLPVFTAPLFFFLLLYSLLFVS